MKKISVLSLTLLSASAFSSEYEKSKTLLNNAPTEIKSVMATAPTVYEFESVLKPAKSSVAYTGQVFRQILMKDIKTAMGKISNNGTFKTKAEVLDMLNSYLEYDEGNLSTATGAIDGEAEFKVKAKDFNGNSIEIDEGFFYSDVQSPGKNLKGKLAGIDNPLRRGRLYGVEAQTPLDYLNELFEEFAVNTVSRADVNIPNGSLGNQRIRKSTVTADGRDLAQLVQKFLYGAVSFSQAANDYMSTAKLSTIDNSKPLKQGKFYTKLEHYFDEGFGYFGAARDYLAYTDAQVKSKGSLDTDKNGFISIKNEMNLGIAANMGKVDATAADGQLDLSGEAMKAFLAARELIVKQPENYRTYVIANAQVALGAWEKTLAAVTIHYINKTIKEMNEFGTEKFLFTDLAKFWSEMKGYGLAAQFSPTAILTDTDFDQVHRLMGQAPVLPQNGIPANKAYQADLLKARDILQKAYKFSTANVVNW